MADDDRRGQPGADERFGQIGGEPIYGLARGGLRRIAVAAVAERQHAEAGRQMRQQQVERAPAVGQAVQQDDRQSAGVACSTPSSKRPAAVARERELRCVIGKVSS